MQNRVIDLIYVRRMMIWYWLAEWKVPDWHERSVNENDSVLICSIFAIHAICILEIWIWMNI